MNIRELIWDDWNEEHIARHGVTSDEATEVCLASRSLGVRMRRGRYRVIGQTAAGRYLTVIADAEGEGHYYVVTARHATDSERRRLLGWRR